MERKRKTTVIIGPRIMVLIERLKLSCSYELRTDIGYSISGPFCVTCLLQFIFCFDL